MILADVSELEIDCCAETERVSNKKEKNPTIRIFLEYLIKF